MVEEKYRRPRLCRLCECPVVDGGVRVDKRRLEKLCRWWKAHWDTDFERKPCIVCSFCVWELRFADENSPKKEPEEKIWWLKKNGSADNYYKYYQEELIAPCSVKIESTFLEEEIQRGSGVRKRHGCIYCLKTFSHFNYLSTHARTVHPEQVIRCDLRPCRRFFHTQKEKLDHKQKEHSVHFKCFYCGLVSTNVVNHGYHLKTRHKGEIIRCTYVFCREMFKTKQDRAQHFREKHNFDQFPCLFCDKIVFCPKSLRSHIEKKHKEEALKCTLCRNYFKSEEDRQRHVQEKHPEDKGFDCIYCSLSSAKLVNLRQHIKKAHKDIYIRCESGACATYFKTEEEKLKHVQVVHERDKIFCVYCDKFVFSKKGLQSHLHNHHFKEEIIRCDYTQCATYFKTEKDKLDHTKQVHECSDNTISCIYCNKSILKKLSSVRDHMVTYHSEVLIKCNYHKFCATYFKTEEDREKHIQEVHKAEKIKEPMQCLYCEEIKMGITSFRVHIVAKHLDVAIKCKFAKCGEYFKNTTDFENHLLLLPKHKNTAKNTKRPHVCLLCAKTFTLESGLRVHARYTHGGKVGEKCPHCLSILRTTGRHIVAEFCKICNAKFACAGLLKSHNRTCKPEHRCVVCAKMFKNATKLKRHCLELHKAKIFQWKRLEFRSRGLKCNECFVYFKTKVGLTLHRKNLHAPSVVVKCYFCHHHYTRKASLKRHIVQYHLEL